ncbi:hypothetical protein [Cytobacillus gottheilii]|uniref:hypothetical protein n=1 Tax=Cytobacillus gottheilii TaxID=859144 RepID=UPI00111A763B|nr:hypothetical protein [Cytobacillus gottheilii]
MLKLIKRENRLGGVFLKKIVSISLLSLFFLTGCQFLNISIGALDTTNLKDITEEQQGNSPITYEAATVEEGLDALPFDMTLPEELPFEAEPYMPPVINDLNGDGKMIIADFGARSANENEEILLRVKVDYPVSDSSYPNYEEVELKKGVTGYYLKSALSFQIDDVAFTVVYMNDDIPVEQHGEEIIAIANQMIE